MSTETTNKKIKIDNGTTFGRTYTDKAIDAKLPTDLIATAKKLSLGAGNTALGNGVNLDGFTYDEATKTLKASGGGSGGSLPKLVISQNRDGGMTADITNANAGMYDLSLNMNGIVVEHFGIGVINNLQVAADVNAKTFGAVIEFFGNSSILYNNWQEGNTDEIIENNLVQLSTDADTDLFTYLDSEYRIKTFNKPDYVAGQYHYNLAYNALRNMYEWDVANPSKSISLFGKHNILVPKDSTDKNIDLYRHDIHIYVINTELEIIVSYLSSSNLKADSITNLDTLFGAQYRFIQCSGTYKTGDKCFAISCFDWYGSFANSNFKYTDPVNGIGRASLSSVFGNAKIVDVIKPI